VAPHPPVPHTAHPPRLPAGSTRGPLREPEPVARGHRVKPGGSTVVLAGKATSAKGPPHPPFGHLLPRGEKGLRAPYPPASPLPLWERVDRAPRETGEGNGPTRRHPIPPHPPIPHATPPTMAARGRDPRVTPGKHRSGRAPSPLAGEGWGGGWCGRSLTDPLPRPLPSGGRGATEPTISLSQAARQPRRAWRAWCENTPP